MKGYSASFMGFIVISLLIGNLKAQELPGRVAGANPADSQTALSVVNPDALQNSSEAFPARNNKGPFTVAWKPVARDTERICIDMTPMQRGIDYEIDYASGLVAFTEPVAVGKTIVIDYKYDPTIAAKNASGMNLPLSLYLYKKDNVGLQLLGLYKQADQTKTTASDMAVVGLAGTTSVKNSEISSMFLFNAGRPGEATSSASSFLDRSALKLGGVTKLDKLQITTSYLRTGADFDASKEYQLTKGMETMDFAASFAASRGLTLTSSYKKSEDLIDAMKGAATSVMTNSVAYNANGGKTSAVASRESTSTGAGDAQSKSTTDQLLLASKLTAKLGVNTSLIRKDTTQDGQTDILGLSIDNQPSRMLSLKAGITRADNERTGADNMETLSLTARPNKGMTVALDMAHRDTDVSGNEFANSLRIDSALRKDTQLELGMTGKYLENAHDESLGTVRLSTTALRNTKLLLDWRGKYSSTGRDFNRGVRLDLTPSSDISIGGAYGEAQTNGDVVTRVSEANAIVRPSKAMQVSGAYKARDYDGQTSVNTVSMALTLDGGRAIKLTGKYAENPEDVYGIVQKVNSQSIGMNSDLGRLKLKGAYTLNQDHLASKTSDTTEVGMDVLFTANSAINSDYTIDRQVDGSLLSTSVYSLGFTRKSGNRLSLYLGGKMTTYEKDQAFLETMTDYQAEAKLGLKF